MVAAFPNKEPASSPVLCLESGSVLKEGVKFSWRIPVLLAVVWIVAGAAIFLSRSARPTPEKLEAYLAAHPIAGLGETQRAEVIGKTAGQLNRLTFEQRRTLREGGSLRGFFKQLSPAERSRFLDLTLPEGFHQMMSALNKMTPEKRQRLVQRALDDLRKNAPQEAERIDGEEVKKILAQGVSSFYGEANADVKLDFAPVLEELQKNLQNLP